MSNIPIQRTASDQMPVVPRAMAPPAMATHRVSAASASSAKPAIPEPSPQSGKVTLSSEELKNLASEIQRKVSAISSDLQFSVDKETGKDIVRVTDRATKKIVWQFPSEEALNITKALDQYQKGVMLNRKA